MNKDLPEGAVGVIVAAIAIIVIAVVGYVAIKDVNAMQPPPNPDTVDLSATSSFLRP